MKYSISTLNDNGSGMEYASKEKFLKEVFRLVNDFESNRGTRFYMTVDSDASFFPLD